MALQSHTFKLIDIGANLLDPMFQGCYRTKKAHADDFLQMLHRGFQRNISKIIITCGNLQESMDAQSVLTENSNSPDFDPLYCTVGLHPTRAAEFQTDAEYFQKLKSLIKHPKVVAIGECGLDYDRLEFCPKDIQKSSFIKQFELAHESNLPMFFHNRNSSQDFIEIVSKHRHLFKTGVVHSFDGSLQDALQMIEMGLYIGINGCSLKTAENLNVVKEIPLDKLMIETDAPWCDIRSTHASFPMIKTVFSDAKKKERFEMGKMVKGRNEPCALIQILEIIAHLKQLPIEQVAEIIFDTTESVFFKSK